MSVIKKQTFQNTIFSYLGVGVGFITQALLIPHFLTTDEVGLQQVLLAYMYILVQMANLGFNSAGSRFFPYFRNNEKKHQGFLFLGSTISLIGFSLCTLVLLWLKPYLLSEKNGSSTLFSHYFYLLFPITLFTLFFNLFDNYAKGLYDSVTGTFLSQFIQRIFMLLALIFLILKIVNFDTYIWLWTLAICLPTVPMFIKIIRLKNFSLKPNFSILNPSFLRDFLRFSAFTILGGLSSQIIQYIDRIMLEHYKGLDDTGIYGIAAYFGSVIAMPLLALTKASTPIVVDAMKNNDSTTISTIYRKSCLTQLIIGGLVFIGILANMDNIIAILGEKYASGRWVIIWIGIGQLFNMSTGINGTILVNSKYYRYDLFSMLSLILIIVIANMIFIPLYGKIGAAIAGAFGTIYYNLARYLMVWWKLKMQPFSLDNLKVLILGGIVLGLSTFLPHLTGNLGLIALDIFYRSLFISTLFLGVIYFSKVSMEINNLLRKAVDFIVEKLF